MNSLRTLAAASIALAALSASGQAPASPSGPKPGPKEALSKIQALRSEAMDKQKRGEPVNEAELGKQIQQVAQDAAKDVDPKTVPITECMDWMTLFQYAKRDGDIPVLAQRAYGYKAIEMMQLDAYVVRQLIDDGKLKEVVNHIRNTGFGAGPSMIGQLFMGIQRSLAAQAPSHLDDVLAVYDALIERIHYGSPITDSDRKWAPIAYANVLGEKYALLYQSGKKDAALKGLNALAKEMAKHPDAKDAYAQSAASYVQKTIARITSPDTQGAMTGKPAPAVVSDRHLGDFAGYDALKGKVVVLDFMAHWCGPCKAALPELVKLQERLGEKGLQILSLTGYYGYYGAKTGISKDEEFASMKGFVKDFGMTWPVLFDGSGKNNGSYGVSGIPQLVVIDRKGVVRKIEVGYTPESFGATVRLIEGLLAEPAR